MNIRAIRSDKIYRKMIYAPKEKREDIYRYELMKPFEFKWQCVGIPLKAEEAHGYDVVSTSSMGGGYVLSEITEELLTEVEMISSSSFWSACENSIQSSLKGFEEHGIKLLTQDYVFTILLNDPCNPMSTLTGDYCGDGGIPGYIIGTIIPNENSMQMLPVALAHEVNHNVRWQYMKWSPNITLADMIVSEGLAENFESIMFGDDKIGKWVRKMSSETLDATIKPIIKANLDETDFNKVSSYLYGDEIMALRGATPIGVPYCAGYTCGYYLVKYYLEKTGKNIFEATITSTEEILKATEEFWK